MNNYEIVGITGNRPHKIPKTMHLKVEDAIEQELALLKEKGATTIIQGGALGVDQWSALIGIELGFKITTYIPFPQQAEEWAKREKEVYDYILLNSSEIKTFGEYPNNSLYFTRNNSIVQNSDILLACLTPQKGGSQYTKNKAIQLKKPIIELKILNEEINKNFIN